MHILHVHFVLPMPYTFRFSQSQQAAASQSTAVDTHAHGTHAQSAAAESNAGNLGAITGVPVEKVGIYIRNIEYERYMY